jgi:hypothetical protein
LDLTVEATGRYLYDNDDVGVDVDVDGALVVAVEPLLHLKRKPLRLIPKHSTLH